MNGVSKTLLAAAALLPAVSQAQQQTQVEPFNYTFVELSYDESEYDFGGPGGDVDGDGLTLSGSFEITEDWHAFASYGGADLDFGLDFDTWAIGAGYRYPLRDDVDIYGRVLYIDSEISGVGGSSDEDGLGLQARIRVRISDQFEVEGGLQHIDVFDSDTSLQASARYHFTPNFSAGIGITFAGDTDGIGINARYSF